jgi:hypothetical protein
MRYLAFALAGILLLSHVSASQSKSKAEPSAQEIARLREVMNIAPDRSITFVPSKELPDKNPLKVYALVVSKLKMRDPHEATQAWVENWNKKNSTKYPPLEAASGTSDADLIFVWFITPLNPNPAIVESFGYNPVVYINSYLIVQKSTGAEIIWKHAGLGGDYQFSKNTDSEFMKRVKARRKALKK